MNKFILEKEPTICSVQNYTNDITCCERACEIYPRNYYAWSYRNWIFITLSKITSEVFIFSIS
jgi:hypothetical protein